MPNTKEILAAAWEGKDDVTKEIPKFSFEYFPPKTEKGVELLYKKVYRMAKQNPLFIDLTWGAGGSTSDLTMDMSTNFKKLFGAEVNMHLTCTNITVESVKQALVDAKKNNLSSICALRGDPPVGQDKWEATDGGLNCALDLVQMIKKDHGDHFSLAVAGYPEGHPNAITEVTDVSKLSESEAARVIKTEDGKTWVCTDEAMKGELEYLKKKCDAGANLILTQLFYDVDVFLAWVKTCRSMGINVPILPGIMPLRNYGGFRRMTGFCKTRIPNELEDKLVALKEDEDGFKKFGIELLVDMSKKLWASGEVKCLHFYCLNQSDTVFQVLEKLGVKINPLDTEEDKAEMAKMTALIKETIAAGKA